MNATFHEIQNDQAPKLKTPHMIHVYRNPFHNMIIVIPKHSFQSMSQADNPFLALNKKKIYHNFRYTGTNF